MRYALIHEMLGIFLVKLSVRLKKKKKVALFLVKLSVWLKKKKIKWRMMRVRTFVLNIRGTHLSIMPHHNV